MTKKRRPSRGSASSRKQRNQGGRFASLAIPIVVGVVVVAIILGVIVSAENQQPNSGDTPPAVDTAQGLATQSIPYPDVPRISLADTQRELSNGQAILVDSRSKSSYDSEHAVGAISMPEEEVNTRLSELPRDKDIILYCT
jgi:hypothetical protein